MNEPQKKWASDLLDKVQMLAEQFGLDERQGAQLSGFVMEIAREQFRVGNKNGASWAFKRAREEAAGIVTPMRSAAPMPS